MAVLRTIPCPMTAIERVSKSSPQQQMFRTSLDASLLFLLPATCSSITTFSLPAGRFAQAFAPLCKRDFYPNRHRAGTDTVSVWEYNLLIKGQKAYNPAMAYHTRQVAASNRDEGLEEGL
jgi:hypothetical protein